MNVCCFHGALLSHPSLVDLGKGNLRCSFTFKITERGAPSSCLIDVSADGKLASFAHHLLHGEHVLVTGSIALEQWESADGKLHKKHCVRANRIERI